MARKPGKGITRAGIKALTFDTFGTVVDWRGSVIADFRTFGRRRKLSDVPWEALVDDWKTCYRPGMDAVNAGGPWTTVERIYREKLDELLPRYGLGSLGESDRQHLNRVWHRLRPWPDAVPGLKRLRRKYLIAPLSNGDVACLANMAKRAGLPWDLILCAELFRRYKPAPEVYLGAIAYLGVQPHEVMMVAAHNYDLANARSHGMRTAFVARPTEYGPGQTTDLTPQGDWDIVARDFSQLARQLGA